MADVLFSDQVRETVEKMDEKNLSQEHSHKGSNHLTTRIQAMLLYREFMDGR